MTDELRPIINQAIEYAHKHAHGGTIIWREKFQEKFVELYGCRLEAAQAVATDMDWFYGEELEGREPDPDGIIERIGSNLAVWRKAAGKGDIGPFIPPHLDLD